VLLLVLAARQWRGRPRPGQPVTMPKWMSAIDSFTLGKAAGLGFALSAVNPKNLVICATAGATIGAAALSGGQVAVAVAVFTVIGASTVAAPVVGYALAKERMRRPLDELRHWLEVHNNAVMTVLLLVIGLTVIGKGIGGL
jgi:threonine/homoserine/homoserine lactone efflux protein